MMTALERIECDPETQDRRDQERRRNKQLLDARRLCLMLAEENETLIAMNAELRARVAVLEGRHHDAL